MLGAPINRGIPVLLRTAAHEELTCSSAALVMPTKGLPHELVYLGMESSKVKPRALAFQAIACRNRVSSQPKGTNNSKAASSSMA